MMNGTSQVNHEMIETFYYPFLKKSYLTDTKAFIIWNKSRQAEEKESAAE